MSGQPLVPKKASAWAKYSGSMSQVLFAGRFFEVITAN